MASLNDFRSSNVSTRKTRASTPSDTRNSLDEFKRNSNSAGNADGPGASGEAIPAPCKAARYILSGSRDQDGLHPHYKTFCKSYRCKYCGPKKVALLRWAIELAIQEFGLRVFATLTLDPKTCDCKPEESAKYIRRVWNKFRVLQKREFDQSLDFISVIEFQGSGFAHLHVLFNHYLPHAWLKRTWGAVGGGTIVDVRKADQKAASYLSKYLGKEMLSNSNRNMRGYSTSQSIRLMKLIKRARGKNQVRYKFCKASEAEARSILSRYLKNDIVDRKNFITGFRATRQLDGPEESPMLHNVGFEGEAAHA